MITYQERINKKTLAELPVSASCPKWVKAGVGAYLIHTNSVPTPVRSTSNWSWYGANKALIPFWYVSNKSLSRFSIYYRGM